MDHNKWKIREHYNKIRDRGRGFRRQSKAINIRNANNFIKSTLIRDYVKKGDGVLDLGCGKGGDILKYDKVGISEYHGIDIAEMSINDAIVRFKKSRCQFKARFSVHDAYSEKLQLNQKFDVISSQFSFHYAFATSRSLDTAIRNVADHLKDDGYFIMTVPSKKMILENLANGRSGNEYYKIELAGVDADGPEEHREYFFSLVDSVDRCLEYFVDVDALRRGLEMLGVFLIEKTPGREFYEGACERSRDLYERLGFKNLSESEMEVVALYDVIVFHKSIPAAP
jgi:mRNA (guanine-N7-)-methyltransferase